MTVSSKVRRLGRPTLDQAEELSQKIKSSALSVFLKYGYEASSLEQVARASGATRRSVVARFPNKEVLLLSVVQETLSDLIIDFDQAESTLSARPIETLKDSCKAIFEVGLSDRWLDFYRLCFAESHKFPAVSKTFLSFNNRIAEDLQGLVERAQRSGSLIGRDASSFATALIAIFISNPVNRRTLGDEEFANSDHRRLYFDALWKAVTGVSD